MQSDPSPQLKGGLAPIGLGRRMVVDVDCHGDSFGRTKCSRLELASIEWAIPMIVLLKRLATPLYSGV